MVWVNDCCITTDVDESAGGGEIAEAVSLKLYRRVAELRAADAKAKAAKTAPTVIDRILASVLTTPLPVESQGAIKVYRAALEAKRLGLTAPIMRGESFWENEVPDALCFMNALGIGELLYMSESSNQNAVYYAFQEAGYILTAIKTREVGYNGHDVYNYGVSLSAEGGRAAGVIELKEIDGEVGRDDD